MGAIDIIPTKSNLYYFKQNDMTVKKLKELLADVPDDMEVFIHQNENDFSHSLAESAQMRPLKFTDRSGPVPLVAYDQCFIISDENHYG